MKSATRTRQAKRSHDSTNSQIGHVWFMANRYKVTARELGDKIKRVQIEQEKKHTSYFWMLT